jgi:hypothetical protein
MTASRSDALVLFGVTGDLAHKMIFPALYAMAKRGTLKVPVIGVASPKWSLADLRNRVNDSLMQSGGIESHRALDHLMSLLSYVSGDYNDRGSKNRRERNRPTNGYWTTPWPAMVRFSPVRSPLRPPGRWSSQSSRSTTLPVPINAGVGGRTRPMS